MSGDVSEDLLRQFQLHQDAQREYAEWLREALGQGSVDAPARPEAGPAAAQDTRLLAQGSPAWFQARASRLTGSNMATAVGLSPYVTPHSYWEMVTGRLAGVETSSASAATRHGNANEAVAVKVYERLTGRRVSETGLWLHPEISWLAASPDGLVGEAGVLEVKCPVYRIHSDVPKHYMPQVQAEMEMTGRAWCDFVSFHVTAANVGDIATASSARPHHIKVFRVARSPEYWRWLLARMKTFWACVHMDEDPRNLPELSIHGLSPPIVSVELIHDETHEG